MSSKPTKPDKPKRQKYNFFRKLVFLALVLISLAVYRPSLIPDPDYRSKAQNIRDRIATLIPKSAPGSSGLATSISFEDIKSKLPTGAVLGEEDVYVQANLNQIYSLIQSLPQEKINLIRQDICRDLIDSAVMQATASSSPWPFRLKSFSPHKHLLSLKL